MNTHEDRRAVEFRGFPAKRSDIKGECIVFERLGAF
jgi:hypothetical protein